MNETQPVTHLSDDDAYEFLVAQRFGRLAVAIGGAPEIMPLNFVTSTNAAGARTIYIRSDAGNKLFAAATASPVALETDRVGTGTATSVIAYGNARIVTDHDEQEHVTFLGLKPWVATYKTHIIAIDLERISGRRFVLGPEPENPTVEVPG